MTGLSALTGCTRVVTLEVEEGPRRLVVEGRVEAGAAEQRVRLTTTDRVDGAGELPRVSGAVVEVSDDRGGRWTLPEVAPGDYRTAALNPEPGRTYRLDIVWQGERYQAVSELRDGPPIDSLYFRFLPKSLATGDSGYRAFLDYSDPPGFGNHYFWEMYVDGERRTTADPGNRWRLISNDQFYDGNRVLGYTPFDEIVVEPGEAVTVRQVAITPEAYRYYFAFYEQSTGGDGPFGVPPASVRGNVANLTTPANRALGYFLTGRVHVRTGVVPPR